MNTEEYFAIKLFIKLLVQISCLHITSYARLQPIILKATVRDLLFMISTLWLCFSYEDKNLFQSNATLGGGVSKKPVIRFI